MTETEKSDYLWLDSYPSNNDFFKPFDAQPLGDYLDQAVERFPDNTCTNFFGAKKTFSQVATEVNHVAAGLAQRGVTQGSKVGLFFPNCPSYVIYYYAVMKLGAVVVNFNPLYSVEELEQQIVDSEVSLLATLDVKKLFDKAESLLEHGSLEQVIVCDFASLLPTVKSKLFKIVKRKELADVKKSAVVDKLIFDADVRDNDASFDKPQIHVDDLAVLQYTGGTTGIPKGAMLTHSNLSINVQQVNSWAPELEDGKQVMMAILPFFHVFGMTVVMNYAIMRAAELVLIPKFEIDEALKIISKNKPTCMPGVPTLFNAFINHKKITSVDMSSLKFCFSGGAPLPLATKQKFEALTGSKLVEGYGLSETAPVVSCNPLDGPPKDQCIGLPMPQTVLSLRDLEDPTKEVAQGERGELCVKGPQVMKGYWKKPVATDAVFVDGFLRTGDVGVMAEDGFVSIVDRLKDIILCSGYNVYPRHIEDALYKHAAVEEATVIGVEDEYRGEAPKAFVKLHEGHSVSADDLLDFLKTRLSKVEIPSFIEFRDELPKSLIGKLSKKELRQEEQD